MQNPRKRTLAMIAIAVLLIPAGYAMITGNFRLAGICVCGLIVVRVLGLSGGVSE